MIDLYYWPTPNGNKITMMLEECELDYTIYPINITAGDQFQPDFLKLSPNNRMPAIVDHDPIDKGQPLDLFESGAILLYLAEKTGKFYPIDLRFRYVVMKWLSGRWVDWVRWRVRIIILGDLHRIKSLRNRALSF